MDNSFALIHPPQQPIVDANYTLSEALAGTKAPSDIVKNLRLIDVEYFSFDQKLHKGQIVVHQQLCDDLIAIFKEIKRQKFPIQHAIPIVKYHWNDSLSMADNNTSCFNYRPITGASQKLSYHSYGIAIDINPLQNPYIKGNIVLPSEATYDKHKTGTLHQGLFIYQLFLQKSWQWGGDWKSLKDYQHFEKPSILLHEYE